MILCTHCQAKNSIDSAFCKSCGREVSELDREQARQENSKLIAEGYSLLAEGRTEEAELVARAGIEADARAAGAHSLLGMCYERQDDIVSALECYERVVELNPDSSLDKIKVTQLRNVLARRADAEEPVSRKTALAGAMACVVLVGAIGAITALLAQPVGAQAAEKKDSQRPNLVADNAQAFAQLPNEYKNAPQGGQYNPQTQDPNQENPVNNSGLTGNVGNGGNGGNGGYRGNDQGGGGSKSYSNPGSTYSPPTNSGLPLVNEDPGEGYKPVTLDVVPRPEKTAPQTPPTNTLTGGEDPDPVEQKVKKPTGSITITQIGNGNGSPKNDPKEDGTSLKALVRTADQQLLTGNYDSAARSLEQAKSRGGDDGSLSKKLALCYDKLGKRTEAIQAYRDAKRQLESKAASDPVAKSRLESVNQALKNLGG